MGIGTLREIWDDAIQQMKRISSYKILFDSQKTNFSSINSLLYATEGMVQIMANRIKSSKLLVAFLLNKDCWDSLRPDTKYSPEFNQNDEIEYKFYADGSSALKWLLTETRSQGLISRILSKKTTSDLQFKKAEEILNIDIEDPLYQLYIKEHKDRAKEMND